MTGTDPLDTMLTQHFRNDAVRHGADDDAIAEQVLASLAEPLPPQRRAWRLWPSILLDWNFTPAWPQVAALASCAVLGFAIGMASPILPGRAQASSPSDMGVVFTAPEPLTGALP